MVRKERLELSHLAAPEPKSGASTNSATSATKLEVKRVIGKTHLNVTCFKSEPLNGGYDGIRTCDPIIMSDVL